MFSKMAGFVFFILMNVVMQMKLSAGCDNSGNSVVYTRWGKKRCNSRHELVHSGYVGGSDYKNPGAAVEPLCLPKNPQWGKFKDGKDGQKAELLGAEYQMHTVSNYWRHYHDHDVPCAVCLVRQRSVVQMFPGRRTCYNGWKLEYSGYLMAGRPIHKAASTYTCVDRKPDLADGGKANQNGYLFYQVEAICGSLKCPPYVQGRELVCAVCSK
uniref:Short-chain collagen C4 n=1 Tax=Magallana gigas TaxID=29159 RepID=A0A8W8IHH6_MAGGI